MAELLLPLRPLLVSPLVPEQPGWRAGDDSAAHEGLEGGPSVADSVPAMHPDSSVSLAMLPNVEAATVDPAGRSCNAGETSAVSPVSGLFVGALQQAPEAAVNYIQHVLEELYPEPCHRTLWIKQLYIAVLEQQATHDSLLQAVRVLMGCPSEGEKLVLSECSLRDLCAAVSFVSKHSVGRHGEHDHTDCGGLCAALWHELVICSCGPRRVLVQYYKSEFMSHGLSIHYDASLSGGEPGDQQISRMDAAAGGSDGSTVLLKDAAPAISSIVRFVQGQANTLNLERCGLCQLAEAST